MLPTVERSAAQLFRSVGLAEIADSPVMGRDDFLQVTATGFLLVAVDRDDMPVGFAACEPLAGTVYLTELSVAVSRQGQGIGARLLRDVGRAAMESGADAVTLTTFENIPWNAPFYFRYGFRKYETGNPPTILCRALVEKLIAFEDLPPRIAMIARPTGVAG